VAVFLLFVQPDAAQGVTGVIGRNHHMVVAVHHAAVGIAAAVGDPHTATGAQNRVKRYRQSTGGLFALYLAIDEAMDVRLTVRYQNEPVVPQLGVDQLQQVVACPHADAPHTARHGHCHSDISCVLCEPSEFCAIALVKFLPKEEPGALFAVTSRFRAPSPKRSDRAP
jgi:hypothetical protein